MLVNSLKIKLTVFITVLLTIGMLLSSLVMLVLWQRQILQYEIERSVFILDQVQVSLNVNQADHELFEPSEGISQLLHNNSVSCLLFLKEGVVHPLLEKCKKESGLSSLVVKSSQMKNNVHSVSGGVLGLFGYGTYDLAIATPVIRGERVVASVGLLRNLSVAGRKFLSNIQIVFVYIIVNIIILAVVGFFRISQLVIRPLEKLVVLADSSAVTRGDLLFESDGRGEFFRLSSSLNKMIKKIAADNKELQQNIQSLREVNSELERNRRELVRVEKLASIGRLSAGMAHEIGNPLTIIHGYLGMLKGDISEKNRVEYLMRIEVELDRINGLIKQLLGFSRFSKKQTRKLHVHPLLIETVDLVRVRKKSQSIHFVKKLAAKQDLVAANGDNLKQVFLNCLFNSIDAVEERGKEKAGEIVVTTRNRQNKNGSVDLVIMISDNGKGIDENSIDKLFDPFFTTKEVGHGTGLGLFVSHAIIDNLGGRIEVESKIEQGTRLMIKLPIHEK